MRKNNEKYEHIFFCGIALLHSLLYNKTHERMKENMISYIKGSLEECGDGFIIVETSGLGYCIFVSPITLAQMPQKGTAIKIHTFLHVKEDDMVLYGFLHMEELQLFQKLIRVSGIGPKAAMGFLSNLTPEEIVVAILSEDVKTLCKAPGVGKKMAQRVILELKEKLEKQEIPMFDIDHTATISADYKQEAVEALTALGYSRTEAEKAIKQIANTKDMTTEELLKAALRHMVRI